MTSMQPHYPENVQYLDSSTHVCETLTALWSVLYVYQRPSRAIGMPLDNLIIKEPIQSTPLNKFLKEYT